MSLTKEPKRSEMEADLASKKHEVMIALSEWAKHNKRAASIKYKQAKSALPYETLGDALDYAKPETNDMIKAQVAFWKAEAKYILISGHEKAMRPGKYRQIFKGYKDYTKKATDKLSVAIGQVEVVQNNDYNSLPDTKEKLSKERKVMLDVIKGKASFLDLLE